MKIDKSLQKEVTAHKQAKYFYSKALNLNLRQPNTNHNLMIKLFSQEWKNFLKLTQGFSVNK
tara:strand:- start:556 stop:741 length:186 start_codon:yes stop_codon:yes gene_type:complete